MTGMTCPFCDHMIALSSEVHKTFDLSFDASDIPKRKKIADDTIQVAFTKCPNCGKINIIADGIGETVAGKHLPVHPMSMARKFPDYIPDTIRKNYEEAYAILPCSQRASAALSRHCLHQILSDFFNIQRDTLKDELNALKDHMSEEDCKLIDALRKSGNLDQHFNHDTRLIDEADEGEPEKLLKLIEYMFEHCYIKRHEQETLFSEIIGLDDDSKKTKNGKK